jgi:hypothetical protein
MSRTRTLMTLAFCLGAVSLVSLFPWPVHAG